MENVERGACLWIRKGAVNWSSVLGLSWCERNGMEEGSMPRDTDISSGRALQRERECLGVWVLSGRAEMVTWQTITYLSRDVRCLPKMGMADLHYGALPCPLCSGRSREKISGVLDSALGRVKSMCVAADAVSQHSIYRIESHLRL